MIAEIANFDGIVGLTHHFGGLSYGNVASMEHGLEVSNPKLAALQGLKKMKFLADLGFAQGVLPPQIRPRIDILKMLGFSGTEKEILEKSYNESPHLLMACSSASSMWCANAGTVTPSVDTVNRKIHITPANLNYFFHRSLETEQTAKFLKQIFPHCIHHDPLPAALADEGAANHIHLTSNLGEKGIHLFVHGRGIMDLEIPAHFKPRQTYEAHKSLARSHQIPENQTLFAKQSAFAIDHGVFHNDVIAMGTKNLLLVHARAYEKQKGLLDTLKERFFLICEEELIVDEVSEEDLSIQNAISSYLFNSQLLPKAPNDFLLLCPEECQENLQAKKVIDRWLQDPKIPIQEVYYIPLRQSMHNGGGPACLRLQVPLTNKELEAVHPPIWMNDQLYEKLVLWVEKHYRDHLTKEDLKDINLYNESLEAEKDLLSLLNLTL